MSWNFPRDEKLHAAIKKMSAAKKSSIGNTISVDRRRAKGVEPCAMGLNKNANDNLLGKRR